MDHRDRASPVALAADPPVAEAVPNLPVADPLPLEIPGDLAFSRFALPPRERTRIHHPACSLVRAGHRPGGNRILRFRLDDHHNGKVVLFRKLEIPLVVRGDRHHRACSVLVQDEVRGEDGNLPAGQRIDAISAGEDPLLFHLPARTDQLVLHRYAVDELANLLFAARFLREFHHQGVLRGHAHEGGAVDRVRPGREHLDLAAAIGQREVDLRPFAAPDPVPLHLQDVFRPPPPQLLVAGEKLVRVLRDAEEPLLQLALGDARLVVNEARPVPVDLFVGKDGLALLAPVELSPLPVGESVPDHPQEEELFPAVILRGAGGELTVPVVGDPQLF